jgi:hypothetical protein
MRRIIIMGTALAALACASAAFAASLNTYSAGFSFSHGAGSGSSPVPTAFTETFHAGNAIAADRAAPLIDIKTTVYGLVSNAKRFPTCDGNQISAQKSDSFCPPKALVATGPVNALLGGTTLSAMGTACNTFLHVWNGGGGKVWYFFTTDATHSCGGLHTGDTQAYPGYISQVGKNQVLDTPLPSFVSTAVAHHTGLYGSLILEKLTFKKLTTKVHGKTVGFISSVGCKSGKRPWSVAFTATNGTQTETKTVSGKSPC